MLPKKHKIHTCTTKEAKQIVEGLNTYNFSHIKAVAPTWTPLEFCVKDASDSIIGGILAGIGYWNGLDIKILWVKDTHRHKGIGSMLLNHIEILAKNKGATVAMLDTFSFQAETFYKKNGYNKIGEIPNFPEGYQRIFLYKNLVN